MRFYFSERELPETDEGIEFANADIALREAGTAALRMAADSLTMDGKITLFVRSEEGPTGRVTASLTIKRS